MLVFAALRTYAIWDKDRRVFAIIFGLGLIYPLGYTVSFDSNCCLRTNAHSLLQYFSLNIVYYASESPVTGCDHVNTLPAWFNISADLNAEELLWVRYLHINVVSEGLVPAVRGMPIVLLSLSISTFGAYRHPRSYCKRDLRSSDPHPYLDQNHPDSMSIAKNKHDLGSEYVLCSPSWR